MPPQLQSINACPLENTIKTLEIANKYKYPAIFAHCYASFVLLPCPYASKRITLRSNKRHEFIIICHCKLSQFRQILSALQPGLAECAKPLQIYTDMSVSMYTHAHMYTFYALLCACAFDHLLCIRFVHCVTHGTATQKSAEHDTNREPQIQ